MKRILDLALTLFAGLVLLLPLIWVAIAVKMTSKGPVLYWSDRVGRNNQIFKMPKFRSMQVGTPAVATHLLSNPETYLTPIDSFLRSYGAFSKAISVLSGHGQLCSTSKI